MPRRLLSFLGVGREEPPHYDSCRYALDELQTEPTRFVQRAISDAGKARGRSFDEIVLLCTEKDFQASLNLAGSTPFFAIQSSWLRSSLKFTRSRWMASNTAPCSFSSSPRDSSV